jgi:murein DD-endopeptidase MepM/ murein hydrolase activator NlpD
MSKIKFEDKNRNGILKQKGFYAAIVVCLLAMGVGTYSAINKVNPPIGEEDTSISITSNYTKDAQGAGKDMTGVPYTTGAEKTTAKKTGVTTKEKNQVAAFFAMPISSSIVKRYSETELIFSETYNDWRVHDGIDISAEKGTKIKAAGDGIVKDIVVDELFGTTVVINHGNGIIAYYCGVNKTPTVKKGQVVEVGTIIGGVDIVPCEAVDQPHLHFYVMKDGKVVSPIDALKLQD